MNTRIEKIEEGLVRFEAMLRAATNGTNSSSSSDSTQQSNPMFELVKGLFDLFKDQVMGELADIKQQLTKQENHLDRLEAYSRRNCVLIHGIPEADAKTEPECLNHVLEIFNNKLDLQIQSGQVDRAHRLGPVRQPGGKPRAVIVKFLAYKDKKTVYSMKKKLKASPLLITESLTRNRIQLHQKASNHFGRDKVWTSDGKICIKTGVDPNTRLVTIQSERELENCIQEDSRPRNTITTRRGQY